MNVRSQIVGCGSYLPERIVTNDEIATFLDTSDEWIAARTGIRQRHIAAEGEYTSDLAFNAADGALRNAGIRACEVDMIVVATTTPDKTFPATATRVQAMLGAEGGPAFDLQAVCTGFIYGLAVADSFIRLGQVDTAIVIGAETMSRLLDWEDRNTCVLFGDGAGAVVLKSNNHHGASGSGGRENLPRGILSTHLHSDGRLGDLLHVDGGPSSTGTVGTLQMSGREVFRHAVANLADVLEEALAANEMTPADIDWVVPHQANKRIIDGTMRKLGLGDDRVIVTIERHANTSAASIPLALDEAVRDGRIQPGQILLMEAMGGGMTWGAGLARW
jgi:3-oxoacyl-[acyl-carrier-protein] synthase-3